MILQLRLHFLPNNFFGKWGVEISILNPDTFRPDIL